MNKSTINHSETFLLKNLISYSEEATVSKILTKSQGGNTTLFAFDKGQSLSEHTAPFDATVYIVDGCCKVTIDSKEYQLTAGELIVMPANIPHALEATESFKMLLIMIKS
ncbi:cupin domain-containing protein [Reichenbachiella versicolor]|uniref:cupin domain-containing protein n=1 Tax=Reichenbachiella versicolor TaxID=1821036 RepID=UPI000D6E4CC8|nr:cupin domain-containing protein [Reichenbachiella versicolor]